MTTLAYALLDLEHERATLVSAGHLPPLLRGPDGETVVLAVEGGAAARRLLAATYRETSSTSRPAAPCCWPPTARSRCAERARGRARAPAGAVRERPRSRGAVRGRRGGVGARRRPTTMSPSWARGWSRCPMRCRPPGPRAATRCGDAPAPAPLAGRWGAADDEIYDITVAVQEASANAVEHAYAPGAATFEVEATCDDGVITVRDPRPRPLAAPARNAPRARNPMMRALMESVDVTTPSTARASCCGARWAGGGMSALARGAARMARRHAGGRRPRARSTPPTSPRSASRCAGSSPTESSVLVVDLSPRPTSTAPAST